MRESPSEQAPVIATKSHHGARRQGMFWKKVLPALVERDILIDLEADINFPFRFDETRVIRSAHFFNEALKDLRPTFFELADLGEGIVKIAATANDITDNGTSCARDGGPEFRLLWPVPFQGRPSISGPTETLRDPVARPQQGRP